MRKFTDLTGQKFGRLTVLERTDDYISPKGDRTIQWLCLCECGNKRKVQSSHLKDGHTKSCGCLNKDILSNTASTHRDSETLLYKVYQNMKQRCVNPKNQRYKFYGGKGITVCKEWDDDYLEFKKWALDNGYKQGLSIDRIDINLGYEPSNCRWAEYKVQNNNRSNNHYITHNNVTKTIAEWAYEYDLSYHVLLWRIHKGWDINRALTTPTRQKNRRCVGE